MNPGDDRMPFDDEPEYTEGIPEQAKDLVAIEQAPTIDFMAYDEIPDMDAMAEGMNLAPQYWEADETGDSKRVVLIGWSSINSQQGGKTPAAVLQNKQGIWLIAGTNLVQQLQNVSYRTPLQITYTGKEKTERGFQVKKFTVKMLDPKPVPPVPDMTHLKQSDPVKAGRKQPA